VATTAEALSLDEVSAALGVVGEDKLDVGTNVSGMDAAPGGALEVGVAG